MFALSSPRIRVILALGIFASVASVAEAARYPEQRANGLEWFYVFGRQGNAYYGAQAEKKIFFVEVPKNVARSVTIDVLDADTQGRYDEMDGGSWNTATMFSVYSGTQLLNSYTMDANAPDGTTLHFGPFAASQGQAQGDHVVFRIEVEGLDGDDNNLFAFDVEPAEAELYALNSAVRMASHEGDRMRLYPAVPEGTTRIRASNYDMDPNGGHSVLIPARHRWTTYRVKSSGSAQWASTDIRVPADSTGRRWTYEITKETQPRANMAMRFEDQNGALLPIYCRPGAVTVITQAPLPPPQPMAACNTFEFDASKSYDPDNQQLTYRWDFGDGATGDRVIMQHTYEKPGTYHVALTVTDTSTAACHQSQTAQELRVNGAPQAVLDAPEAACTGTTISLSAAKSAAALGGALTYHWDLGDGTTAEGADVTHAYTRGGTYQVRLAVDDRLGTSCSTNRATSVIRVNTPPSARANDAITICSRNPLEPLMATFDASRSADADGQALMYRWDFGDGATEEGARVTHYYQKSGRYTAHVIVDDGSGTPCATATADVPVAINRAPIVVATQDVNVCAGSTIPFDASMSTDPDGDPLTFTWNFGDGTTATGAKAEHRYDTGGTYHVTVKADDGSGMECAIATARLTARVNTPPRAVAKAVDRGCVGQRIIFDASDSSDPDGQRLSYHWDFGDGTTADGARVEHAYQQGGSYPVALTVDDGSGTPCGVATARGTVRINTPPVASAGPNLVCCLNDMNVFDASKSYDPDGDALTYHWDFGDGTTADGMKVQHAYTKHGAFQVRVTVSDGNDCGTSTTGFIADVNAPPVAQMDIRGEKAPVSPPPTGGLSQP